MSLYPDFTQYADRRVEYAIVTVVSTIFFGAVFAATWFLCDYVFIPKVFQRLTLAEKADWCSRTNSQIHALVIVPGFIATLAMCKWHPDDYNAESPLVENVRYVLAVSAAYFTFDLGVLLAFRVPLWGVFVAHHIVAIIPCYFQLFRSDCQRGTYILAVFLLVEFATIFFNMQSWCETLGYGKETCVNAVWFWLTYAGWFLSRVVLTAYCLIEWWRTVIFPKRHTPMALDCLILESASGHIIFLFCLSVFLGVLTPELIKRWKGEYVREAEERRQAKAARRLSSTSAAGGAPLPAGSTEPIAASPDGSPPVLVSISAADGGTAEGTNGVDDEVDLAPFRSEAEVSPLQRIGSALHFA